MLFENIALLDESFTLQSGCYLGTEAGRIAYIGSKPPTADYGERYPGAGRLLLPGFYNCHAHTPMTLLRGWGEGLPLARWLNERIFPFEAKLTDEDIYWGTLLGLAESLRFGIVSTSDMYNGCEAMARAVEQSGAKASIGRHVVAFDDTPPAENQSFREAAAFFKGFHMACEGRLHADIALHAEYTSNPATARHVAEWAAAHGARVQVHVAETQSETEECRARHGQSPAAYLAECGLFDVPATAAHCVWLDDADRALLAEKDVTVASCPASNLKLGSGICNTAALLAAGVRVAVGTDGAASNNSLAFLEDLKLFALLPKGAGPGPEALTPQQALYAATAAGAKAQGRENAGRLAVGAAADLILIDTTGPNLCPAPDAAGVVYAATPGDVCLTMVDGRVLYREGEYQTLDLERIRHEVTARRNRIVATL